MLKRQRLPGSAEKPLDRWLRELLAGKSWNEVRRLARTGKVFIDGVPVLDPTQLVPAGAEIEVRVNAPRATRTPSLPKSAVLYVDAQHVVVEKPAGISTVPYDENESGTLDQLVMETLAERGECIVGDLVLELPVSQPTVSEHLKVLREAGIVRGTVDGPNRCYCLNPEAFVELRTLFESLEQRSCC